MCIDGMAGYDEMHTEKCRKKCWQELEKNKHSAPRFQECQHGKKEGKDTLSGILRYFAKYPKILFQAGDYANMWVLTVATC